jgi:ABC-2 type transport system permease protein
LVLFMLAVSWFAAMVGLFATSPEAASGFTFFVMFLPYASSAFVPIDTMPSWLHGFSRHQPCTPVIESIRALLAGHAPGSSASVAAIWCVGILVVSVAGSTVAFRRRTAG